MIQASIASDGTLATLLGCVVPPAWPKDLAEVEPMFLAGVSAGPEQLGWWGWYGIHSSAATGHLPTLVVTAGVMRQGRDAILGYATLAPFEGRGYASQAASAIADWAQAQPAVDRVIASTFERHSASRRVLEKAGFLLMGPSPADATTPDSDRQGRGTLLEFARLPLRQGTHPPRDL